ncbi:S-methyl-5-thioribose-1-phosphate isomerase [Pseudoramibacter alactolyticus]|jgi:methylthioribose-1-phosphate isomerase|uniref:S-methyl-5-thioribose-1-phosphate isomerase n=1 Tax=Pseudoramibacter alactolyticus TaxID=113287 RepID=UPI00235224E7|nr:S-methyl-5-thioribose-1-phosphate isomerase [Pseudoramibacter alactolyticus]MBM6968625.1 S-methyl-5-thioribose-1-phosphate isomerase [Pseudoramibacter alactolyticus]
MRPVYFEDEALKLIDQTLLPTREVIRSYTDYRDVCDAIVTMVVRGAPAIGVTAGYAVYLAAREFAGRPDFAERVQQACDELRGTRPTAVNLFWAIDRQEACLKAALNAGQDACAALRAEADAICAEDIAMCRAMGRAGAALLHPGDTVLTHCNAGALATADYGTALGVIRAACEAGKQISVYADETRPLLQGARLTAYELHKDGIPVTLITDNMAGWMMHQGKIDAVIVGADRITRNGDVANKIGTYSVSVLARAHGIPFYVAAPTSTIDFEMPTGDDIVIEERDPSEVGHFAGVQTAPEGVRFENPAFDVTPHQNVSAIITEKGVLYPPYIECIPKLQNEG